MGPYSKFDIEKNPILIVHDWSTGLYFFNIKEKVKTPILASQSKHAQDPQEEVEQKVKSEKSLKM